MSFNALLSLPAPSITLALGGLTTSYVFFSNVSDYQRGCIAFLNGRVGPSVNQLDQRGRVRLWAKYFKNAALSVVGTSVVSSLLNLTTAYMHPSANIRQLALWSGLTSLLIFPITALSGLLTVNSRLNALASESDDKQLEFKNETEAKELIAGWESRHLRRMPTYAIACLLSWAAIILDGRV
ncbi:hypothetical protein I316_03928 [Kwoniella heveanensis BCC8398]|uniref:DUF1772-domain-containing protein n=1 Tax=Kwoniella heveanensis BCC8398 TaxID=1296120 RepID=A0A1B9GTM4_9TREE|nr:hypothetical protein I316_03928 [Kwoniella heveanensis BCC8398]